MLGCLNMRRYHSFLFFHLLQSADVQEVLLNEYVNVLEVRWWDGSSEMAISGKASLKTPDLILFHPCTQSNPFNMQVS